MIMKLPELGDKSEWVLGKQNPVGGDKVGAAYRQVFFFLLVSWCLLPENIILLITVFCHSSFYYTIWQQAAYWNENKWFKHLSEKQHNLWISIIFWIWSATDARIILNVDSGLTVERGKLLHCFLCAYYPLQAVGVCARR